MKTRLLTSLAFRQYGLACKYGAISSVSIYNWTQDCIIRGVINANQTRLQHKFDSIYFLKGKRYVCLVLKLMFVLY